MRMLLLVGALLFAAAPAFACGYQNETASTSSSGSVASTSTQQTPPPSGPNG
jgi:hypothetical protein